jgi:uncharacterized protein YbcI
MADLITQGTAEAAIAVSLSGLTVELMGKGAENIRARVIADTVLIRLIGSLTNTEQHLASTPDGCELLQLFRRRLMVTGIGPPLRVAIEKLLCTAVLGMFYDCNVLMNEEIFVFTLLAAPVFRANGRDKKSTWS